MMISLMLSRPFGSWVGGVDALRLGLLFFGLICPTHQLPNQEWEREKGYLVDIVACEWGVGGH
jgi:hypothetical protein